MHTSASRPARPSATPPPTLPYRTRLPVRGGRRALGHAACTTDRPHIREMPSPSMSTLRRDDDTLTVTVPERIEVNFATVKIRRLIVVDE